MLVVDLSNNNSEPNWSRLSQGGIRAVYLKATEGRTYVDPKYHAWRHRAAEAGLHVGSYHFARPDVNSSGRMEAEHFAAVIGKPGVTALRPALDFETPSHLSPAQTERWARDFSQELRKIIGVYPLFYSYTSMIGALRFSKPVGNGLWVADYSRNDGKEHPYKSPAPWKRAVAHQFTSRAVVAGCYGRVDVSSARSLASILAHPVKGTIVAAARKLVRK